MLNIGLYKEIQILRNFNSKLSIRQIIKKYGPLGKEHFLMNKRRQDFIKQQKQLIYESSDMIMSHEYAAILAKFNFKRNGVLSIQRQL